MFDFWMFAFLALLKVERLCDFFLFQSCHLKLFSQPVVRRMNTRGGGLSNNSWSACQSPNPSLRIYDNPNHSNNLAPPPPTLYQTKPSADNGGYAEIGQSPMLDNNKKQSKDGSTEGLTWVEVSNRECQTPSHWLYNNMTLDGSSDQLLPSYQPSHITSSNIRYFGYISN